MEKKIRVEEKTRQEKRRGQGIKYNAYYDELKEKKKKRIWWYKILWKDGIRGGKKKSGRGEREDVEDEMEEM